MREDRRSAEAERYRAWYSTVRWRRLRSAQLSSEPLCRMCRTSNRITAATVCDHIEPHKGDEAKFWAGPFQSLCKPCHDGAKQQFEKSGRMRGCDADGWPLDDRGGKSLEGNALNTATDPFCAHPQFRLQG